MKMKPMRVIYSSRGITSFTAISTKACCRKANLGASARADRQQQDDRNAATILAARQLGYQGEILALVEDPFHRQPIILAGASSAYTPRHVLGAALAARASQKVSPTVAGIQHLGHKLQVAEARITRDSPLAGKTLAEADLGQHAGVTVIGQWVGGKLIAPPTPDMRLEPGGILSCSAMTRASAIL